MKMILLVALTLIFAISASAQLPELLQSEFSQANNTQLVGTDSWIASPYSSDGGMVTSNGSAVAVNTQGTNFFGGMIWDDLLTNNGTDTAIIAFSIPVKSETNRYFPPGLPGVSDLEIFLFMDSKLSSWNGTVVRLVSWDNNQFSIVFNSIVNGCVDYSSCANYGGSGNADWGGSAGNGNDTIAVKVIGQRIIVERHTTAGVFQLKNVVAGRTIPSSGYMAARLRLSTTPTTQLGAFFLGAPSATPPAEVNRDTIPPVKVLAAPNVAAIDTSIEHYYVFRAQDINTAALPQKNPGLKYMTIRVDSLGGPFKDSVSSLSNYPNIAGTDTTIITVQKKRPTGWYVITNTAVDDSGNVTIFQYQLFIGTAQTLKVMAYYDIWQWSNGAWWSELPDRLNYRNGITHLIQFMNGNVKLVNPFFGPVAGVNLSDSLDAAGGSGRPTVTIPYRDWWIDSCHANGIKALICVNAVNPTLLSQVIDVNGNGIVDGLDSARADTLANAIANYLSRNEYDGVDINIEHDGGGTAPKNNVMCFLRRLRVRVDQFNAGGGGNMLITLSPTSGDWNNYDVPGLDSIADFVNTQTYDQQYSWNPCVNSNANWYWSAVYHASNAQLAAHNPPYDQCWTTINRTSAISERGPLQWAARGLSIGKTGIGISTYGRLHSGSLDPYGPMGTDNYVLTNQTFLNNFLAASPTAVTRFDTVTKGTYTAGVLASPLSFTGAVSGTFPVGTNVYYTYPTQATISAIVDWAKANGVGSIMMFDYQYDNNSTDPDVTKRNPVIEMVASTAGGGILVTPPPAVPVNTAPTNNAVNQVTNGTVFTWSSISGATSYNLQLSTVPGFSVIDRQGSLSTNTATIGVFPFSGSLVSGQTYYWRVNATTPGGTSSYSTPFSFTTASNIANAPSVPLLVTPVADSLVPSTTVVLTIQPGASNDTIQVLFYQVKSDTLSGNNVYFDTTSTQFTATVSNLIPSLSYWWRAAAKNTAGRSAYTGWRKFTVTAPTVIARQYESVYRFNPTVKRNVSSPEAYTVKSDISVANLPTSAIDSPYVVAGVRGWKEANGTPHQYAYVTDLQTFNFNAVLPLSWSAATSTLMMPNSSVTQDGYLSAANFTLFSGAVTNSNRRMFYWMLPAGLRDSTAIVFKAGSNVTLTKSSTGDTLTIAATGGGGGVTDPDTSLFTVQEFKDEFIHNTDGVANMASGALGSSANLQGDLGWTPYALVNATRARIFTVGSQYVNTSTYSPGMGWTYLVAPDSSDGTTPTGGWLTFARSGPVKYARPVKAIMEFVFQAPEPDSTYAMFGFSAKVQGAEDVRLTNTDGSYFEVGSNNNSGIETVYVVSASGSAKTKTLVTTVAAGSINNARIVYNASSIDFYVSAFNAAFGAPTTISTNLGAGTTGITPFIGGSQYKMRTNGAGINTNHMTAIDAWRYKEWFTR